MKRIILSVLAAGTAALTLAAAPARADEHGWDRERAYPQREVEPRFEEHADRQREFREREQYRRAMEWRELQRERRMFYSRWNGNPWRRARFERYYRHRCDELRGY